MVGGHTQWLRRNSKELFFLSFFFLGVLVVMDIRLQGCVSTVQSTQERRNKEKSFFVEQPKENGGYDTEESRAVKKEDIPGKSGVVKDTSGYVMAAMYNDQMTGGAINIVSLQCWASSVLGHHMKVVEPFLTSGSRFGYDFVASVKNRDGRDENNVVRMGDVYDLGSWERQTKGFAPFVSWDIFIGQARERKLIIVGSNLSGASWTTFKKIAQSFAEQHNTTIARVAEFNSSLYTPEEFKNLVYGTFSPRKSAVIFHVFGGVISSAKPNIRVSISDMSKCYRSASILLRNSQLIKMDGVRYQDKYMSSQAISKGYISVMLRLQAVVDNHRFWKIKSDETKLQILQDCVDSISRHVHDLKEKYGLESVFLTMDCRKHGSLGFRDFRDAAHVTAAMSNKTATTLYQKLYGSSSLDDWDDAFDAITSYSAPGYVAQLQKYVAYNGVCLVTAGGGSFQQSAIAMYNETHQPPTACAIKVPEC